MALLVGCAALAVLAVGGWLAWPHIVFRLRFEPLGKNAKGLPEYRHRHTGIIFVRVPGGTFQMGSPNSEAVRQPNEGPVHEVTLSAFLVGKFEVTQAEWKGVMGSNPSKFKGDDLPVETVSWNDCQEFCRKTGFKLPTEAQWEYSCRAGTSGPFAGTGKLDDMGWYRNNSSRRTHAVGRKTPNDFGLFDMHGNIWEWCEDVYAPDFYSKPEAARPDPVCTSGAEYWVWRGASWLDFARFCRSAYRLGFGPGKRSGNLGLRAAFYPLP